MKVFLTILFAAFLAACTASKDMTQPEQVNTKSPYDESFDPMTLEDDDIVIAKVNEKAVQPVEEIKNMANEVLEFTEVKGFRVQILATKSIEAATLTEQEATDLFATMKHKIYLIFEAPLYKIRVGDVTDRDSAEEIRDVAKDYGYREAFIVPSKVNVPLKNSL